MVFICNLYTPAIENLYEPVTIPFFVTVGSVTVPFTVVLSSITQLAICLLAGLSQNVPAKPTVDPILNAWPLPGPVMLCVTLTVTLLVDWFPLASIAVIVMV